MSPNDRDGGQRHPGCEPGGEILPARRVLDLLPAWLGVHLSLALITVAVLSGSGTATALGAWFLLVALVLGWQAHLWWRCRAAGRYLSRRSIHQLAFGAGALGAAWGLAAVLFEAPDPPLGPIYLPFVLAGLVATALPALAGYLAAYLAFVAAALVPFALHLARTGSPPDLALAAVAVTYLIGMAQLGRRTNARLVAAARLSNSIDITERKHAKVRMRHLAQHDSLTGLPNRLLFHDRLRHALARCRRDRTDLAVMLLDLDNLQQVNHALGHRVGDRILEEVALRLRAGLRESDTVARIGGDEFALILPVLPETEAAAVVARKILTRLEMPVEVEDRRVALRASLGLALFPHDGDQPEVLLQNADLAMYRAKAAGGGFHPLAARMRRESDHRLSLERELQHAIERGQLRLEYQPLLDLQHRSIRGVEALVRWRHPELGEVGPEALIRTAEESGQIERIGAWILAEACTAATTWRCDGGPLRIAVNVSGDQLRDSHLVELVRGVLADTGWPAEQLELELTETGPIAEVGEVAPMVERLRELGVSLAIDDFGAGHTGLGHLRQLPLDALKIDRSLVTDLEREADAAIAASLIDLGHRLRLRVVAEGVETPAQLAILQRLGCDEAQGHIVGAPASRAEMAARLEGETRAAG